LPGSRLPPPANPRRSSASTRCSPLGTVRTPPEGRNKARFPHDSASEGWSHLCGPKWGIRPGRAPRRNPTPRKPHQPRRPAGPTPPGDPISVRRATPSQPTFRPSLIDFLAGPKLTSSTKNHGNSFVSLFLSKHPVHQGTTGFRILDLAGKKKEEKDLTRALGNRNANQSTQPHRHRK